MPVASNGIAFTRVGAGSPVLLIHGVGLCGASWYPQIEVLKDRHRVVAIDLPGHGGSASLDSEQPDLDDYVAAVAAAISEVGTRPAVLVGHSMGAMLALQLAAGHPELCTGIAALNAIFRRDAEAGDAVRQRASALRSGGSAATVEQTLSRWFPDAAGDSGDACHKCRNWLQRVDPNGYADAYSVFAVHDGPTDEALKNLRMPALFLTGEEDYNSSPAMSEAMAARAQTATATVIRGARHMAHLTHAAQVNDELLKFVAHCEEIGA